MTLSIQPERQPALLGLPAPRAGDFVLPGFDHHRLNDRQFGDLSAYGALGRQRLQVLPASTTGTGVDVDDLIRRIRQWTLGFGMPGFRPAVTPALGLRAICLWVARWWLRRVVRGGRRPLQSLNFSFQPLEALGQLYDQSNQFVARQVTQAIDSGQDHRADYNTRYCAELRAPLLA